MSARKTHCPRGHPLVPEPSRLPWRYCRICRNAIQRKHYWLARLHGRPITKVETSDAGDLRCARCRQLKPATAFDRDRRKRRGRDYRCRQCRAAEYVRRRATPQHEARDVLQKAMRAGKLVKPTVCEDCGQSFPKGWIHGHHEDYSQPLAVRWLCQPCHGKRHRKYAVPDEGAAPVRRSQAGEPVGSPGAPEGEG